MKLVCLQRGVGAGEMPSVAQALLSWPIAARAEVGYVLLVGVLQCGKFL